MNHDELTARLGGIAHSAHLEHFAVSVYDTAHGEAFGIQGDRLFHAASTFKVAILLAFAKALESGQCRPVDHLQIRNRFLGLTTGLPYRIAPDRDGDSSVHTQLGKSWQLQQLARVMITRSSNLATNLLLDYLSLEQVRTVLRDCGVSGVEVRRGVEDLAAHEAGINNEATADGLVQLFRCFLAGGGLAEEPRQLALEILQAQEFNRMIPALLPRGTSVAHKTGEISTHCHDTGLVFPPDRAPYAIAILTETSRETDHRQRAVAEISAAVYRSLMTKREP